MVPLEPQQSTHLDAKVIVWHSSQEPEENHQQKHICWCTKLEVAVSRMASIGLQAREIFRGLWLVCIKQANGGLLW